MTKANPSINSFFAALTAWQNTLTNERLPRAKSLEDQAEKLPADTPYRGNCSTRVWATEEAIKLIEKLLSRRSEVELWLLQYNTSPKARNKAAWTALKEHFEPNLASDVTFLFDEDDCRANLEIAFLLADVLDQLNPNAVKLKPFEHHVEHASPRVAGKPRDLCASRRALITSNAQALLTSPFRHDGTKGINNSPRRSFLSQRNRSIYDQSGSIIHYFPIPPLPVCHADRLLFQR
jgi:hypothetical protein